MTKKGFLWKNFDAEGWRRAARAEKGSRSTKGRVAFPWPCCLIKRGIFRIPFSAPCGFLWVSAFCLWQELVLMPTFALTQIGVDTGSDSFPINLTPDTRNVCHEARLFSNCSPSHQHRSLLKRKFKKSVKLNSLQLLFRNNSFLQGGMQWVIGEHHQPAVAPRGRCL